MSWLEDITSSIKYIEGHLTDELTLEKLLQRLIFRHFIFKKGFRFFVELRYPKIEDYHLPAEICKQMVLRL